MRAYNRFSQLGAHLAMTVFAALCIVPFLMLLGSSLSDNRTLIRSGYSLWPRHLDFAAYEYLWRQSSSLLHAFGISALLTVGGTIVSLAITSMLAYPLSRRELPARNAFAFAVFFTLLFNGGLVPTYMVYTQLWDLKDSLLGLMVPGLLMSGFNVFLMRTFFATTISDAIIESAGIDGAGPFRIYCRIVLPLSLPVMATVGLLQAIVYWNDWFNGLLYITRPGLLGFQSVLNQMLSNINFLATLASGGTGGAAIGSNGTIPSTSVRMAIAFIGVLPILLAYPFFQRYFVKGITVGAVKG